MEEEEKQRQEAALEDGSREAADAKKNPGMSSQQSRALSILRRLAFGMNRCVAKSNGEMAYQLLYEQEQYVTYRGYNMFFRYVPFAIMRCREEAIAGAIADAPHLSAAPVDFVTDTDDAPVALDEIAEVMEDEGEAPRVKQVVVQFNQKDDYLHRGSSVLLRCMSLVMYSRFVRRVPRAKAGKVDGVKFFAFDEHYPHHASSVQDSWVERSVAECFSFTFGSVFCFCVFRKRNVSQLQLQEVRATDDNVVVPSDLHLPQDAEVQKYAAHMLGLCFPFPTCSGDCSDSYKCFSCHSIEKNEKECMIFGRFAPQWRHWKACMVLRREAAQERMLAGLSMPVIRDVITVRRYVPRMESSGATVPLEFLKIVLDKKLRPRDCRMHDVVRIVERIAWCLGVALNYHYTQLSPLEFLCIVQTTWLERFEQHHAARRISSSRRRAERFALMTKVEDDDLEDDAAPPDIEGDEVEDDLRQQDELERMERAQYTLDKDALQEALFREQDWMRVLGNPRATVLKDTLRHLRDFVNALGGVPDARTGMGIRSSGSSGVERTWTSADAERGMTLQKQYLEFCAGGQGKNIC